MGSEMCIRDSKSTSNTSIDQNAQNTQNTQNVPDEPDAPGALDAPDATDASNTPNSGPAVRRIPAVLFDTPGCSAVRLSRSPLLRSLNEADLTAGATRNTWSKETADEAQSKDRAKDLMEDRTTVDHYLRLSVRSKDRFVELVNEMLNMRHVVLAAEEQNAVAATVFGRKKYALLKLVAPKSKAKSGPVGSGSSGAADERRSCNDFFVMKKTGFEKNAAVPVKRIYDTLFKNVMLMNHTSGLLHNERFVCKIVDHRSIMYGIFDSLLAEWQRAVREDALATFSTRVPLNPRQTGGKLADFIERTLREHQYNPGDRVSVLRLLRVDAKRLTELPRLHDSTGAPVVIYDTTDSEFVLLDDARGHLDDYMLDIRLFLGGHLTYLYQCIEGQQTLRDGSLEPVATHKDQQLKMRTLRAIAMLFYATWLWDRVLRSRHEAAFGSGAANFYALNWRGLVSPMTMTRLRRDLMCLNLHQLIDDYDSTNPLEKMLPNEAQQRFRDGPFLSPPFLLFHNRFTHKWLSEHSDRELVVRNALFWWDDEDEARHRRYANFLRAGVLKYHAQA